MMCFLIYRTIAKNFDLAVEAITTADSSSHMPHKLSAFLKTYFRAHNKFLAAKMTSILGISDLGLLMIATIVQDFVL